MDRPIEFRLILKGEIVGYEKHESGLIYHSIVGEIWLDFLRPLVAFSTDNEVGIKHPNYIPHDSKDQLTPHTDKEGNKIWENDEVRLKGFSPAVYIVKWSKEQAGFYLGLNVHTYVGVELHYAEEGEVVGHTHPELEGGE